MADHGRLDVSFMFYVPSLLNAKLDELQEDNNRLLQAHIREQRRLNRSLPADKIRPTWEEFSSRVSSDHFRRMFRMSVEAFTRLCCLICARVGEDVFRKEEYLIEKVPAYTSPNEEERCNLPIPGEVKVAIALRLLAGGSYLDLIPLFLVSKTHVYNILNSFIKWVHMTLEFPLTRWLRERNWTALRGMACPFAEKSNGIFYGPFGALDGLAVRMKCPSMKEVPDPGNYYCQKGFYALNVQAICDKGKRFLWCYPSNKGSTHDSAAFSSSKLYDLLKEMPVELQQEGLFIVGDSAYCLAPFLVTPYDQDEVRGHNYKAKDAFNYHLSSCRIYIECAFGELVMRWGIFWRTLLFEDLRKCANVVQVCMLLHNFIIDSRENYVDTSYFKQFDIENNEVQQQLFETTGKQAIALVTDNNEPRRPGRPTVEEVELRQLGSAIRERLTIALAVNNLVRPMNSDMHFNQHGHIYMSS